MKKKCIFCDVLFIFLIGVIAVCSWRFAPVSFLKDVDSSEVASIDVFNGGTGRRMILEDPQEIDAIVKNVQSAKMRKGKRSSDYDGFAFSLRFQDKDGNEIDSFIINSNDQIRDDPFFYECVSGELCISYLRELEDKYCIWE